MNKTANDLARMLGNIQAFVNEHRNAGSSIAVFAAALRLKFNQPELLDVYSPEQCMYKTIMKKYERALETDDLRRSALMRKRTRKKLKPDEAAELTKLETLTAARLSPVLEQPS
jgi:hypothetical protein